jgi:pilus assembly protein Flp/PilA
MEAIVRLFTRICREEDGQDMVEYALILGLISVIAVVAVTATGTAVNSIWEAVEDAVTGAVPGA